MASITPELARVVDRTKVSDRKVIFVVSEFTLSLGYDTKEVSLNRSMFDRNRIISRIHRK